MIIQEGKEYLINVLLNQISGFWIRGGGNSQKIIEEGINFALNDMSLILSGLSRNNKYVHINPDKTVFNLFNSVQYSIFLYLTAKHIYKLNNSSKEADMVYYLNKIMNNVDWFYAVELPELFYAEHPVGSVMGRAHYGNRFFFYQGCTVGGNRSSDGELFYPIIGDNVLMYADSKVLGKSQIGNNVILSADCAVLNETVPDNCIVFGKSPNLQIKKYSKEDIKKRQSHIWEEFDE